MSFSKETENMLAEKTARCFASNVKYKIEKYSPRLEESGDLMRIAWGFAILTDIIIRHGLNPLAYLQAVAEAYGDAKHRGYNLK